MLYGYNGYQSNSIVQMVRAFSFNIFCFLMILLPFRLFSQTTYKTVSVKELKEKENILIQAGDSILHGSSDSVRIANNEIFKTGLEKLLSFQNTFAYPFDSLKTLSILKSKDGILKIYTWILPSTDGTAYSYFGFVQVFDKKTREVSLYALVEKKYENAEAAVLKTPPGEWYGALYYMMVEKKYKGNTLYTILGWQGNNRLTTRKVIDILTVTPGKIAFGAPVFKGNGKPLTRVIFEYTAQAVMKLTYDEKQKMIVFDRLSAPSSAAKNQYEFYGPDFRYDGYKFKKGYWLFQKDLDLRNPRSFDQKETKKEKQKEMYEPAK
jgi:hypothetical protein